MSSSWRGLSQGHWPAPVCMAASFLCLVLSCHAMFFLHYHPGDPFYLFPLCWISCFLYQMSSSFFGFLPCFGRTKSLFMRDSQQVSLLRSCLSQKCLFFSPVSKMSVIFSSPPLFSNFTVGHLNVGYFYPVCWSLWLGNFQYRNSER